MGGIADYSGSLVLQMPIAEACHVALQTHPLDKQQLWKHIQARHDKLGGPRPALRVVSYHADDTNRAPTFDMDLDDLFEPDGSPIPYESLRRYFRKDPASAWGAYVAGCLLVLARERRVTYPDGISILVCSDVPEGKGVSSSAALEVAVMAAVSAARGVKLRGRELALLCQKAENLVVGAPCGIMDQLSSSMGDAGELLALLCQPAEVQGGVPIPPQVRFWGIDSGIRHSVGGSDYASVRVGTFMGLKIVSEAARRLRLNSFPLGHSASGSTDAAAAAAGDATSVAAVLTAAASPLHRSHAAAAAAAAAGRSAVAAAAADQQDFFHQHHQQQQQHAPAAAAGGGGSSSARDRTSNELSRGPCPFGGYLANISPSHFRDLFEEELPTHISGSEFLELYGPHLDSVTSLDAGVHYAVREPTAHPIHENFRVNSFRALLAAADALGDAAVAAAADDDARGPSVSSRPGSSGAAYAADPATAAQGAGNSSSSSSGSSSNNKADDCLGLQKLALHNAAASAVKQQLDSSSSSSSAATPFADANSRNSSSQQGLPASHSEPPAALLGPLETLGELMFQSHASYSACGLGSDGTNRLVNIVREHMLAARKAGRAPALYGAKITGGGCGGTVCVLGLAGSAGQAAIDAVVKQYQQETGYTPFVFAGSSVGAMRFGHMRLKRR